jgi:hypothetical protein
LLNRRTAVRTLRDGWTLILLNGRVTVSIGVPTSEQTHYHVIVLGTGFAGLGMAIRLRQQAMTDFEYVVYEQVAQTVAA